MNAPARRSAYTVRLGDAVASSTASESRRQLLRLQVVLDMDGPVAACTVELADAASPPPAIGDAVSVELDGGDGLQTVFTGTVAEAAAHATGQRIVAHGHFAPLGAREVEAAYDSVAADFIVKDLLDQAGATAGTVAAGPDLAAWTLQRSPTALGHLRRLALLCGADLYADGRGAIHCAVPRSGAADHRFTFGENILRLQLARRVPAFDSIEVWGEGADQGADKAHWLSTDLAQVSAKASVAADGSVQTGKLGQRPLRLREGALRSGAAAEAVAKAWATRVAAGRVEGSVEVFAAPKVCPGDLVGIDKLPDDHPAATLLDGPLRVRSVRHELDRQRGAITRLGF